MAWEEMLYGLIGGFKELWKENGEKIKLKAPVNCVSYLMVSFIILLCNKLRF